MADTPKKKIVQTVKSGPKPRHPQAGWVLFEVSPAVYQHLDRLVHRSALGEDVNEVAKSLFTREVERSMKEPTLHQTHPDTWYVEVEGD